MFLEALALSRLALGVTNNLEHKKLLKNLTQLQKEQIESFSFFEEALQSCLALFQNVLSKGTL